MARSRLLRRAERAARPLVAAGAGALLGVLPLPAEPWPHLRPALSQPVVSLAAMSDVPEVLHCTVRPGHDGCVSFEPAARGVVAAVLYSGPYFTGTRVIVHLEVTRHGCTPGTAEIEGSGDLGGPIRSSLRRVGSVETFNRCDVRLHEEHLGTPGATTKWLRDEARVPDEVATSSFSIS